MDLHRGHLDSYLAPIVLSLVLGFGLGFVVVAHPPAGGEAACSVYGSLPLLFVLTILVVTVTTLDWSL